MTAPTGPTAGLLDDALDLVHEHLADYVIFPAEEAADALTLWIAATHNQPMWEHASRFVLKSPVKRCGKTRVQEIVRELVYKPLVASSPSAAALVRSITDDDPPTLVLDEADTYFSRKASDDRAEALRNILNSGHSRGWPYLRWDVKAREVEKCPTFAMAILAGIGDLPDTIEDRGIVVSMQRRAPGERVRPYRQRDAADLHVTRSILAHALKLTLGQYESYESPNMPVTDRAADVWEPLIVIADAAGGDWPTRARTACVVLTAGAEDDEQTLSQRLLEDLHTVWDRDEEHLATATILDRLHGLEESPWPDYYGRPLNPRDLAKLLRPYQVRSKTVRLDEGTAKGYARADLYPVWTRYTFTPAEASQASHPSQDTQASQDAPPLTRDVTDVTDVTDSQGYVQESNVTDAEGNVTVDHMGGRR